MPKKPTEAPIGGDQVIISGKKYDVTDDIMVVKERFDQMTPKQRKWFEAYLATRDGTQSAKVAGYAGGNETLRRTSSANLQKFKHILDIMDTYAQDVMQGVTTITEIYEFWGTVTNDVTQPMNNRLKASELLAKAFGVFANENGDTNVYINTERYDEVPLEVLEGYLIEQSESTD